MRSYCARLDLYLSENRGAAAARPFFDSLLAASNHPQPRVINVDGRRPGAHYFPICHFWHTFATRLRAGGFADHFVTQMLRQGDAKVFRKHSQAKLVMVRESIEKLDRETKEYSATSGTVTPNWWTFGTVLESF